MACDRFTAWCTIFIEVTGFPWPRRRPRPTGSDLSTFGSHPGSGAVGWRGAGSGGRISRWGRSPQAGRSWSNPWRAAGLSPSLIKPPPVPTRTLKLPAARPASSARTARHQSTEAGGMCVLDAIMLGRDVIRALALFPPDYRRWCSARFNLRNRASPPSLAGTDPLNAHEKSRWPRPLAAASGAAITLPDAPTISRRQVPNGKGCQGEASASFFNVMAHFVVARAAAACPRFESGYLSHSCDFRRKHFYPSRPWFASVILQPLLLYVAGSIVNCSNVSSIRPGSEGLQRA